MAYVYRHIRIAYNTKAFELYGDLVTLNKIN